MKSGRRAALLSLLAGVVLFAQEGHPLAGTWHGEWHPASGKTTRIVMYMKWNSGKIEGMLNPGPNAIALKAADFQGWNVHIEADAKGGHISADGKMDKVGSYHRTIAGTWTEGSAKGDFLLTRDD